MEVKGTLVAYIGKDSYLKPKDLQRPECLSSLLMTKRGTADYFIKQGYTEVGEVEVIFHPVPAKELVTNKIDALKQEAKLLRAETTAKVTKIEAQIQNLLSIGFDESSVFAGPSDESEIPF